MKKLLSITLALVMVLSVFAFSASAVTYETKTVDVKWNFGYVGSSTNGGGFVNKINTAGTNYSYSDVIDMGPAGSTITFSDDASAYASAAAYVFSFWKKNGEEYELDLEAANVPGGFGGAQREYTFVTTEANQGIRITYRSEQKADFTPEFPDVYVDGVKVSANWNFGYVKADGTITANGSAYSYTDVIVVEKAGSRVTFTDDNKNGTGFCSNSAYVFSTWAKDGDAWKFVSGIKGVDGATYVDSSAPYSYTSTKDNELVRLCYCSGETATAPIDASARPVVTLKTPVADPVVPDTPVTPNPGTGDATLALAATVICTLALAAVAMKKRACR